MIRTFPLKVILTVVTEFAFVDKDFLVEFLEFFTNTEGKGLEATLSGLVYAADMSAPVLKDQMPFLKELDTSTLNGETREQWIADAIAKYGEFHRVEQMSTPLIASPMDAIVKAAVYHNQNH